MRSLRVQAVAALVLAIAAFGGAQAWKPTVRLADSRPKVDLERLFPKTFGDWLVDERTPAQLVSPDTAATIAKIYAQTLSRTYVNAKGDRIMLSVAYGGDQSDATRAHRPEVCYPAQGFQILSSLDVRMDVDGQPMRARRLVSRLGGRVEPITYWMTVGERLSLGGTEQKLQQLAYTTRGVIPDGMLVRISSIDADSAGAFDIHRAFVAGMMLAIPTAARAQVFGRTDA